jgi:hypothetical protein
LATGSRRLARAECAPIYRSAVLALGGLAAVGCLDVSLDRLGRNLGAAPLSEPVSLALSLPAAKVTNQSQNRANQGSLSSLGFTIMNSRSMSSEIEGPAMFKHACRIGLEGVVCKVRDSRHTSGRRNDWVKKTCAQRETLTIAGFSP